MAIRVDSFGSGFDFNPRNRLDPTRFSIPTLGIDPPRLSSRVNSNRQDSSRLIDPTRSVYATINFAIISSTIANFVIANFVITNFMIVDFAILFFVVDCFALLAFAIDFDA